MTASANDQPNVRLAQTDAERAAASKLLFDSYGVDVLVHEQKSGAKRTSFCGRLPTNQGRSPRSLFIVTAHRSCICQLVSELQQRLRSCTERSASARTNWKLVLFCNCYRLCCMGSDQNFWNTALSTSVMFSR